MPGSSSSPPADLDPGLARIPYSQPIFPQPTSLDYPGTTVPVALHFDPLPPRPADLRYAPADAVILAQRIQDEAEYESYSLGIAAPPSVRFTRETWWDALLVFYAADEGTPPSLGGGGSPLSMAVRDATTHRIAADLRFLFQVSLHWFSFLNIPRFYGALFDPYRRQALQPSLILSALALGTFFQSSELEKGGKGRQRALELLDQAHATFDASLSSGWVDVGLVQAAWVRTSPPNTNKSD